MPESDSADNAEESPPLTGIRVLDFTRFVAGPYATMLMADAGADVIKVEPIGGEATRSLDPKIDTPTGPASGYFHRFNRSKRSICVDFHTETGLDLIRQMLPQVDVLVENYRPGALEAMGLGYDEVRKIAPRLIYCSISGYGQTESPHRLDPAFAILAEVSAGVVGRGIRDEDPPIRLSAPLGDLYPASMAVTGISLALYRRERSGKGSRVDMAMFDALVSLNENAITMSATTGREVLPTGALPYTAPFGVFKASDGYICIAVLGEKVWLRFATAIGHPELGEDESLGSGTARATAMNGELGRVIRSWLAERTREEAVATLVNAGVPSGPVATPFDIIDSAQAIARNLIWDVPSYTGAVVRTVGSPIRMVPNGFVEPREVPAAGQHTAEVLGELAGVDTATLEKLAHDGVIAVRVPTGARSNG